MEKLNSYQTEQLDAITQVRNILKKLDMAACEGLKKDIKPYLEFRTELEQFTLEHLGSHCTQSCFESKTSACCSKDGIITFWADVVVNALSCHGDELDRLSKAIRYPMLMNKCIYLGKHGCLWKIRPLVCAMFVCDRIQDDVFNPDPHLDEQWHRFGKQAKGFRWPDHPVLFDRLEGFFMEMGCRSPLMYINTSPGLLRIKKGSR